MTVRRSLLVCGILASLLHVVMNIVVPMQWEGYNLASRVVSELSAIDAPTRRLWVGLALVYSALSFAFGCGVWVAASGNRALRVVGALTAVTAVIGLAWPPMHQREVLAAGGGTLTDVLHIVWTAAWGLLAMLAIGFGAAALGRRFRVYSIVSLVLLVGFGVLTSTEASGLQANLPTPWIGVWERINMAVYMLWVVVLAVALLRHPRAAGV